MHRRTWYKVYGIEKDDPFQQRVLLGKVKKRELRMFIRNEVPERYHIQICK